MRLQATRANVGARARETSQSQGDYARPLADPRRTPNHPSQTPHIPGTHHHRHSQVRYTTHDRGEDLDARRNPQVSNIF